MSKTKYNLIATAGGALIFMTGDYLVGATSMPPFLSRLIGAAVGISFYFCAYAYLRNKQSK